MGGIKYVLKFQRDSSHCGLEDRRRFPVSNNDRERRRFSEGVSRRDYILLHLDACDVERSDRDALYRS